jgi:hypothetical protein
MADALNGPVKVNFGVSGGDPCKPGDVLTLTGNGIYAFYCPNKVINTGTNKNCSGMNIRDNVIVYCYTGR